MENNMTKKKEKKIVIFGRMAFITVSESNLNERADSGVTVLGLFDKSEKRVSKFTNEIKTTIDQLNILYYLNEEIVAYQSKKKQISNRYIVSDKTDENHETEIDNIVNSLEGNIEIEHCTHFSELTGYLYTDNVLNVGGHNLLKELESFLAI